jgi:glutamate 5-kinase
MSNLKVVKFGSETLQNDGVFDFGRVDAYAAALQQEAANGLIVVTSGAIAVGKSLARGTEYTDQQYAALGMTTVFGTWERAFREVGVDAASTPVTHEQLDDAEQGAIFKELVTDNITSGIVTVVNEADALSVTELMEQLTGGDNDGLARHVAVSMGAASLVLVTKKGGIKDTCHRSIISKIDNNNYELAEELIRERHNSKKGSGEDIGRGGMLSKLYAAREASRSGVETVYITSPSAICSQSSASLKEHADTTQVDMPSMVG